VLPSPWPTPAYYQATPADPARTILISGSLSFDDTAAALLLDRLPPVSRIAAASGQASVVAPVLRLLADETAGNAPGSATMRKELTCILFIQVLRALLKAGTTRPGPAPARLARRPERPADRGERWRLSISNPPGGGPWPSSQPRSAWRDYYVD
jgi:hypothetical protein